METTEQLLPTSEPHDRGAPKDGSYESDSEGLRQAAKDLSATRDKESAPIEFRADLLPTVYEESGEDVDKDKGADPRDVARALSDARQRRRQQAAELAGEESEPEQEESTTDPLAHPDADRIRAAAAELEEIKQRAATHEAAARRQLQAHAVYQQGLAAAAAGQIEETRRTILGNLLAQFPELNFDGSEADFAAWRQNDPERFAQAQQAVQQAEADYERLSQIAVLRQAEAQAAQQQVLQQQWQAYAAQEDTAFAQANPDLVKDPKKAEQAAKDALAYLKESTGLNQEQIAELWTSAPWFRSSGVQQALLHASRYWKLQKNPPKPSKKPVPPVQRPGAAREGGASDSATLKSLREKLDETGSVRDAARLRAEQIAQNERNRRTA